MRKKLGFTQIQLALKLGTTQTTVARWEGGFTVTDMALNHMRLLVEARKVIRR